MSHPREECHHPSCGLHRIVTAAQVPASLHCDRGAGSCFITSEGMPVRLVKMHHANQAEGLGRRDCRCKSPAKGRRVEDLGEAWMGKTAQSGCSEVGFEPGYSCTAPLSRCLSKDNLVESSVLTPFQLYPSFTLWAVNDVPDVNANVDAKKRVNHTSSL